MYCISLATVGFQLSESNKQNTDLQCKNNGHYKSFACVVEVDRTVIVIEQSGIYKYYTCTMKLKIVKCLFQCIQVQNNEIAAFHF